MTPNIFRGCSKNISDGSTVIHIGNNDYKTYYYTWEQATAENNACPAGWSLPTKEQWDNLVAIVGSDKDGAGKWWNNTIYGAFAGNCFNGTLFSFGYVDYWRTATEPYQSYFSNGTLSGPYTYSTNHWFVVRCVKK